MALRYIIYLFSAVALCSCGSAAPLSSEAATGDLIESTDAQVAESSGETEPEVEQDLPGAGLVTVEELREICLSTELQDVLAEVLARFDFTPGRPQPGIRELGENQFLCNTAGVVGDPADLNIAVSIEMAAGSGPAIPYLTIEDAIEPLSGYQSMVGPDGLLWESNTHGQIAVRHITVGRNSYAQVQALTPPDGVLTHDELHSIAAEIVKLWPGTQIADFEG